MDAKKFVLGFDVGELQDLSVAVAAELANRGYPEIGSTAVTGALEVKQLPNTETSSSNGTPEVSSITEKLETLSPTFRKHLLSRYDEARIAIDGYFQTGKLRDESYRLPDIGDVIDKAVALAPTFEHMLEQGWKPNILFVPLGMHRKVWNRLLTGRDLPDGNKTKAVNPNFRGINIDPTVDNVSDLKNIVDQWDVVVIDENHQPTFNYVSKDGRHGLNAGDALRNIRRFPNLPSTGSSSSIIAEVSPSQDEYFAMQLSRLERGLLPVDFQSMTMGKEFTTVDGVTRTVVMFFDSKGRQIKSSWSTVEDANSELGIRVSVSGSKILARRT